MKITDLKNLVFASVFFPACATMGTPFVFTGPNTIVIGQTTKSDLLAKFGQPFRVGYENGKDKWTYGYYKYKVFGDSETKDLDVVFNKDGKVSSYTYNSSYKDEVKQQSGG